MTFLLATPSTIESPVLTSLQAAVPQIANAANVTGTTWQYSALTQLRDLEDSGELIRGLGDLRISPDTAMRARLLLLSIRMDALPSPIVSPISGGGLSIVWLLGQKEVKFSVDPGGEIAYFKIKDDEIIDDGEAIGFDSGQITKQVKWILDEQA